MHNAKNCRGYSGGIDPQKATIEINQLSEVGEAKRNASQWIVDGMQACLPKGCPLPFTAIESATFIKKDVVRGKVRLFDGLVGTLQVSREPCGASSSWCIGWLELPGGAMSWTGIRWKRAPSLRQEEQEEPL